MIACRALPLSPVPATMRGRTRSDIGKYMGFGAGSGVRDRPLIGRADILREAPERTGLIIVSARLPLGATRGEHVLGHIEIDGAGLGIDADLVAVLDQCDRAAISRFGADMADAKAAGAAREAAIGDQRNLLT